jgi:CubicO group peptidase (beta-lactamase class C family)
LAGHVERDAIPGLVALVARRDEIHVEVIGAQEIGGPSMRRDTILRITSMTKPIIAAAVIILIEEGKLRLDEPVDRLLPELERSVLPSRFPRMTAPSAREARGRQHGWSGFRCTTAARRASLPTILCRYPPS